MKNLTVVLFLAVFVLSASIVLGMENNTKNTNENKTPNSWVPQIGPVFQLAPRQFRRANKWIQKYSDECENTYRWRYDSERQSYVASCYVKKQGGTYKFELLMDGSIQMRHTIVGDNYESESISTIGYWDFTR